MTPSVLYPDTVGGPPPPLEDRRFAADLNLDQVFAAACAGRDQTDLLTVFYTPLSDVDSVAYRHEVLTDLERAPLLVAVRAFGQAMRRVRDLLTAVHSLHNRWQQDRLFLDAVWIYCEAVGSLASSLGELKPASRGLHTFTQYLRNYCSSAGFCTLVDEASAIVKALSDVRYTLHIRGTRVTVGRYWGEPNYAKEVEEVFAKFREGASKEFTAALRTTIDMDDVEAQVLDLVARLNPGPFGALDRYSQAHRDFLDDGVANFDRDSQFYLAFLEYIGPMRSSGLAFCYPRLSMSPGTTRAKAAFDLALAAKLIQPGSSRPGVVTNDFDLGPEERILVVTGPNNGGKTTFSRAFGQLHYLASLGLLVPAKEAELVLADEVFTSFGQVEQLATARSHLEDELVHLHRVIGQASPRSVIVMNESFSSTTVRDATVLGKAVLAQLLALGSLCIYVTFVDELATENRATVSMVATVHPEDPVLRTYKVVRKPPEGLAYAAALAERYGLTYGAVEERVAQ
jgi:DNA mismatch repair protein MutS